MKAFFALAAAALVSGGCSNFGPELVCTDIALPGIAVGAVDAASGQRISTAGMVSAQEGAYDEQASAIGEKYYLAYERAGTYVVTVQVPGYQLWRASSVVVSGDRCHVHTVSLTARLAAAQ